MKTRKTSGEQSPNTPQQDSGTAPTEPNGLTNQTNSVTAPADKGASTTPPAESMTDLLLDSVKGNWGCRISPFELEYFDRELLKGHGLTDAAIDARGYFSLRGDSQSQHWLRLVGFSKKQSQIGRCIVAPVRDSDGNLLEYILLPRELRYDKKGHLLRELLVKKPLQPRIFNVSPPSFFEDEDDAISVIWTHSTINADSAAGHQVVAISLHGESPKPAVLRQTLLSTRFDVLGGIFDRLQVFVIDSHLPATDDFYVTLSRIATILHGLGAEVSVVYLPRGDAGRPTTLASFLASGHTVSDLWTMSVPWSGANYNPTEYFLDL